MCFANSIDNLTKFRDKKKSVIVWKLANLNRKTGLATTWWSDRDQVVWLKKTTVVPHKIRKPLRDNQSCGPGLYFYTKCPSPRSPRRILKARVKPEDIIAVNFDASQLCCVAAFVLDAPDPDQTEMRIKYLNEEIRNARDEFKQQKDQIAAWEAIEPERREALQQMLDEAKELKG